MNFDVKWFFVNIKEQNYSVIINYCPSAKHKEFSFKSWLHLSFRGHWPYLFRSNNRVVVLGSASLSVLQTNNFLNFSVFFQNVKHMTNIVRFETAKSSYFHSKANLLPELRTARNPTHIKSSFWTFLNHLDWYAQTFRWNNTTIKRLCNRTVFAECWTSTCSFSKKPKGVNVLWSEANLIWNKKNILKIGSPQAWNKDKMNFSAMSLLFVLSKHHTNVHEMLPTTSLAAANLKNWK